MSDTTTEQALVDLPREIQAELRGLLADARLYRLRLCAAERQVAELNTALDTLEGRCGEVEKRLDGIESVAIAHRHLRREQGPQH